MLIPKKNKTIDDSTLSKIKEAFIANKVSSHRFEDFEIDVLLGGLSRKTYSLYHPQSDSRFVVKLYHMYAKNSIEGKICFLLEPYNLTPKLLASTGEMRIEEYVHFDKQRKPDMQDKQTQWQIALFLGVLHNQVVEQAKGNRVFKCNISEFIENHYITIDRLIGSPEYSSIKPRLKEILGLIPRERADEIHAAFTGGEQVFSHLDLGFQNMSFSGDRLLFYDFEFSDLAPQWFDLSRLLYDCIFIPDYTSKPLKIKYDIGKLPSEESIRGIISMYLFAYTHFKQNKETDFDSLRNSDPFALMKSNYHDWEKEMSKPIEAMHKAVMDGLLMICQLIIMLKFNLPEDFVVVRLGGYENNLDSGIENLKNVMKFLEE